MNNITTDHMNTIIEYWDSKFSGDSPFKGQGQMFIDASIASGLDPVYILAHAGVESAWGTSEIATTKYNYFGIGAFDHAPLTSSFTISNNMYDGIISGAVWIASNYYNNNQTSLYSMRYNNGTNEYCTSTTWIYEITDIIKTSYRLIQ